MSSADWTSLELAVAATLTADHVLSRLLATASGLSPAEAATRLARIGHSILRSHGARPLAVLLRQARNPLLILLVAAALTSFVVGERASALIILAIICMGVGLGLFNEYRSELAVPMLPTQILLNNLLYDASEMTIPTDNVDEEQLQRPAHWDTAFIRRFMTFLGRSARSSISRPLGS